MGKRKDDITLGVKLFVGMIMVAFFLLVGLGIYRVKQDPAVLSYLKKARDYLGVYISLPKASGGSGLKNTEINYSKDVDLIAEKYNLPAAYLKALIVLECSGVKPVKPRLEKHVFKKLKRVRENKGRKYEVLTHEQIKDASDAALENLARSWGPFQLMGYKCLQLGVKVNDIRGEDALDWGAKWIEIEYGNLLRKGRFRDAFHYHNTGRVYPSNGIPKTHDPNYVAHGLDYMEYFQGN